MVITSPFPEIEFPQTDILTYLFGSGNNLPDTPLWINAADTSNSLSPRSALQWIKRLGMGLDKLGVGRGDVVMLISPNHVFVPVAYLGVVGAGRVFSGANPMYTADEMAFQMQNTNASIVLVHPALLETARKAAKQAGLPENKLYLFSDTTNSSVDGIRDWRSMLGSPAEASAYKWQQLSPFQSQKQIATVNYSSGTTGLPKGVMITHANLIANSEQCICIKFAEDPARRYKGPLNERHIGFLPLFHAFGQLNNIIIAAKLMLPIYVMSAFDFEVLLQTIQSQKITHMPAAPPIMVLMSKHPATAKYDLSSLESVVCGAAPLSQSLQNECTGRFDIHVGQGWGMTEVTCAGTACPERSNDTTGSVGQLVPGCEAKLVNEHGAEVARGERGEIYIRGPNVTTGYWKNEKATRETMAEGGWLKTGDVGVCNEEGWFYIVDRLKELIKVSGLQVAPAELEAVLLTHPSIADSGVVGVQDSFDSVERVRAYVLKSPAGPDVTSEDVQSWMRGKVAKHKWLTGGVVFVNEIPKSAAGKIQRKVLREWAKREVQQAGKAKM